MSTAVGIVALGAGVVLVVGGADVFVDGLLGVGRKLGVAPFVLTVALSGFETENLAAGIAANAKGLPGARLVRSGAASRSSRSADVGMPATNNRVAFAWKDMHRIANGQVIESWHLEDTAGMLQRLGESSIDPPPSAPTGSRPRRCRRPDAADYAMAELRACRAGERLMPSPAK